MRWPKGSAARFAAAAALSLFLVPPARCFLGFGDTSFVTVIANPAEAANWAAELDALNSQLASAEGTLRTVGEMRAFAGDPRAAAGAVSDLAGISSALGQLSAGAQTEADLLNAWQALGPAQRLQEASSLLGAAGAGATMNVFGQAQARDASLYAGLARDSAALVGLRSQVASEQAARASVASELSAAWVAFKAAPTESSKQAILAEISQLDTQSQVMDARRRAVLDDLALSDRQDRSRAVVRSRAADEELLAESALLNAGAAGRVESAESQRTATLGKTPRAAAEPDYGAVKLWTTADAGGASP